MRNLKFRTWGFGKFIFYENYLPLKHGDNNVLQFTGLTDKDGKEIYEGDIVEILPGKDGVTIKEKVVWIDDMGCYNITTWVIYNEMGRGLEDKNAMRIWFNVIGNSHENPELLKGT